MATVSIDEREYELDQLTEEAKQQIACIQFIDAELQRLNLQAAVLQTARGAYASALRSLLPA